MAWIERVMSLSGRISRIALASKQSEKRQSSERPAADQLPR